MTGAQIGLKITNSTSDEQQHYFTTCHSLFNKNYGEAVCEKCSTSLLLPLELRGERSSKVLLIKSTRLIDN